MSDDITKRHEARGDVQCEMCSAWVSEYGTTLDDLYLCLPCGKQATPATPEELARYGLTPHLWVVRSPAEQEEGNPK